MATINRYEVSEVYRHPNPVVDIVLVHGLNGHPEKTWTSRSGVFWPSQLLPDSLKGAPARVLVYGYNADVYAFGHDRGPSSDMIHQHAQTLISTLATERLSEDMEENPIIWIAHSLGGILVKRALAYASDLTARNTDDSRSIFVATYGIVFLGTPHTGSDRARMGQILEAMCNAVVPKSVLDTHPGLVKTLRSNNETLQNINLAFLNFYQRFEIDFVHETIPTELVKGVRDLIVDQTSASPQLPGVRYYGIEATHSQLCKFETKKSPGFLNVATQVRRWINDAPPLIRNRFAIEHQRRLEDKQNQMRELLIFQNKGLSAKNMPGPGSSATMTPGTLQSTQKIAQAPQYQDRVQQTIENVRPTSPSFVEVSEVEDRSADKAVHH